MRVSSTAAAQRYTSMKRAVSAVFLEVKLEYSG